MNKFQFTFKNTLLKNTLELFLVALIGFVLPFWVAKIEEKTVVTKLFLEPLNAQTLNPDMVAQKVYEQMPDLPKENQYFSQETQEKAIDHTLISRMIRYHRDVKGRPTEFRLDWKLTFADYLDANETINESRYPGITTLTQSPFLKDKEIINSFTSSQREKLVNLLVSIYNPQMEDNSNSEVETKPSSGQNPDNRTFQLPKPGSADLLLP